jgi:hypothetical protein
MGEMIGKERGEYTPLKVTDSMLVELPTWDQGAGLCRPKNDELRILRCRARRLFGRVRMKLIAMTKTPGRNNAFVPKKSFSVRTPLLRDAQVEIGIR